MGTGGLPKVHQRTFGVDSFRSSMCVVVGGGGAAHPQYANYWAPLTRKRHTMPHPAQPRHTNDGAPRTRKRHQQKHRPQRPTESSDPMQHGKGRTGDCPGPRKETATRRNVTRGVGLCPSSRTSYLLGGLSKGKGEGINPSPVSEHAVKIRTRTHVLIIQSKIRMLLSLD